jgi:MFS family permease
VIPSVLVSVAVTPILLSISPTPAFDTTKPMSLRELVNFSPLGAVGMAVVGAVFAAQFGMSAVYGAEAGLSVAQITLFVSSFFVGAVVMQFPIGWLSDRMERRLLVIGVSVVGFFASLLGMWFGDRFPLLLTSAFILGGMLNPLYSLLIAHTNDFLEHEDMAAASSGLVFINGLGAVLGPMIVGWMMGTALGPGGFYLYTAVLFAFLVLYAGYRSTRRAAVPVDETGSHVVLSPSATPTGLEYAQEYAIEAELEGEQEEENA